MSESSVKSYLPGTGVNRDHQGTVVPNKGAMGHMYVLSEIKIYAFLLRRVIRLVALVIYFTLKRSLDIF